MYNGEPEEGTESVELHSQDTQERRGKRKMHELILYDSGTSSIIIWSRFMDDDKKGYGTDRELP